MIRINLLPQAKRKEAASTGTHVWGYVYFAAVFAWCIALAFVYFSLSSDLDQALAQNVDLEQQIQKVKGQSGNLQELQKQLDQSKKLEEVINGLLSARQGPSRMLLELSAILSPGRGPTVDQQKLDELRKTNPEAGFTPGWDTRRLWITGFQENGRSCQIKGAGRNNEDIAEFLRRLTLSRLFESVVLVRTGSGSAARGDTQASVAFELTCKVRY
ncbi:MAG: PilN domain-containing protein [Myxococcales bacterium]